MFLVIYFGRLILREVSQDYVISTTSIYYIIVVINIIVISII